MMNNLRTKKKKEAEKKIADEVIQLNTWALEIWEREFTESYNEAEKAREYLLNRGISAETQKNFRIGYAPILGFFVKSSERKGADEKLIEISGFGFKNEEKSNLRTVFVEE